VLERLLQPEKEIKAVHEVIKAGWNDEQENPQWRVASLTVTHKGKGDHKDLNNHQGVALQDLMSRLLSSILSEWLLDGPIALHGTQAQFGLQTGHRLPLPRCHFHHQVIVAAPPAPQPTNAQTLHVDLVKAFDTANHQLLSRLLKNFGVPEHMTGVIEQPCEDAKIKIKIGKED
jgi:hypothetical protein